uniref:Trans-2-enoyl-CoA reductase, mitochondrial n=1 Tax=Triatoma infestans TaxID=30076 RepID=A0A170Y5V8_TRIIF
MFARRNPNFNI